MSKSFYNYIVNDLLLNYFTKANLVKGDRYYLVVDNSDFRNSVIESLKENASPITISHVYESIQNRIGEEPYHTFVLKLPNNLPSIIVATDEDATEDYLTTLRNSIGTRNSKYENYCILYILKDCTLSSLLTTSLDLTSSGAPLNPQYISENIRSKISLLHIKTFEKEYLHAYLNRLTNDILNNACSLFDFANVLSIINQQEIAHNLPLLDFFLDESIHDMQRRNNSTIRTQVENNQDLYSRISVIMSTDNDEDRNSLLKKVLDDKLAEKLLNAVKNGEDWRYLTNYQAVLESIDDKKSNIHLTIEDIACNGASCPIIRNRKVASRYKSHESIILFEENGHSNSTIRVKFNKSVKGFIASNPSNWRPHGNIATLNVENIFEEETFGKGNNKHTIAICKLPFKTDFLTTFKKNIEISKNKINITITSPEDEDIISFGKSDNIKSVKNADTINWEDDFQLNLHYCLNGEKKHINFSLVHNNVLIPFKITIIPDKEAAQLDPQTTAPDQTYELHSDFPESRKVEGENGSVKVSKSWMPYLKREQEFIDSEAMHLRKSKTNQLSCEEIYESKDISIPQEIKDCLKKIFSYFRERRTLPSISRIDEELANLYREYCNCIRITLDEAENTSALREEQYNLTRLGVIQEDETIYFSPFHPLMVAYQLERAEQLKDGAETETIQSLISPTYLTPHIYFGSNPLISCQWGDNLRLWNWLKFEKCDKVAQTRTSEITVDVVKSKLEAFLTYFNYLFQDKDCPIILSFVGIVDDSCIVKGILEYIKDSIDQCVQRIEIHVYVRNIIQETYYEKLNKMVSDSDRISELQNSSCPKINLNTKGEYSDIEIINALFSRVKFYKHDFSELKNGQVNSHLTFYQMTSSITFEKFSSNSLLPELSLKGLHSSSASVCFDSGDQGIRYYIGYGGKHVDSSMGAITSLVSSINTLYAHEKNGLDIQYIKDSCLVKQILYTESHIVETLYKYSTWVTFIDPEVDINFFYKQSDTYIVHYADQYNLGSRYDSITVTKKTEHYRHLLRKPYEEYATLKHSNDRFFSSIMRHFNCLCGNWLLGSAQKRTKIQIRERMSLVAASVAMLRLLKKQQDIIWVPLSIEEASRISKSILKKNIFGATGPMSDDLLFLGFNYKEKNDLKLHFYPVEVKCTESLNDSTIKEKGKQQVCQSYYQIVKQLNESNKFDSNIIRTFLASLYLTCADKLHANELIDEDDYHIIENNRFNLLNLNYSVQDTVSLVELGHAAVVTFSAQRTTSFNLNIFEKLYLCEIIFSMRDCVDFIANPESKALDYLKHISIQLTSVAKDNIENGINTSFNTEESNSIKDDNFAKDLQDNLRKSSIERPKSSSICTNSTVTQNTVIPQPTSHGIKIELGVNKTNNKKVFYEPNNTNKLTNPNMAIIGTMGTGKTQQALSIVAQLALQTKYNVGQTPIGILIFDYKGDDYSKEKFLNIVGGTAHRSNFPFNPLKLIRPKNDLVGNLPAITADNISGAFATVYSLGPIQKNNIYNVILETYKEAGITGDPNTWDKKPPTMNDVVRKYLETHTANDKAYALLQRFEHFTIFEQNSDNCVSMFEWLDRVRVIDLSGYGGDDTKKIIVSLILDLFYAEMKQLGESAHADGLRALRSMVLVDEAHHFLSKGFSSLRSIISEGRMFGVGMILSTQTLSDFKSATNDYSEYILSWLIHNVNKIGTPDVCNTLNVEKQEADKCLRYIRAAKKHESICKLGNTIVGLRDLPFYQLLERESLDSTNVREQEIKTQ